MASLLIWGGPVMAANLKGVNLPSDTTVLTLSRGPDGGIGSSSFALLADSYTGTDGRILSNLLRAHHLDVASFDRIAISGFSAFHGLANKLLFADPDLIGCAVALDACFSAHGSLTKRGYVGFGAQAAMGEKLFVMTASSGGGDAYSTGYDCVWANAEAAAAQAGMQLVDVAVPAGVPEPERAAAAGDLFVLDYRSRYTHGGHVHDLGAPVLNAFLVPYLNGTWGASEDAGSGRSSALVPVLAMAGAAAVAATAGFLLLHAKKEGR